MCGDTYRVEGGTPDWVVRARWNKNWKAREGVAKLDAFTVAAVFWGCEKNGLTILKRVPIRYVVSHALPAPRIMKRGKRRGTSLSSLSRGTKIVATWRRPWLRPARYVV